MSEQKNNIPILPDPFLTFASKSSIGPSYAFHGPYTPCTLHAMKRGHCTSHPEHCATHPGLCATPRTLCNTEDIVQHTQDNAQHTQDIAQHT